MCPHSSSAPLSPGRAALSLCPWPCSRHSFLPQRAPLLAGEDAREGRLPLRPRPLLQLLLVLEGNPQLLHDGVERKTLWGEGMALDTSRQGEPGQSLARPSGEGRARPGPSRHSWSFSEDPVGNKSLDTTGNCTQQGFFPNSVTFV